MTDDERAKIAQWWEVQPKVEVPVPADGAKVLIVKFNDYQCPACKLTFEQLQADPAEVHRQRTGEVRRQAVPARAGVQPRRARTCVHYASCEAAASVIMAKGKGTSDKLEDWIFSHIGPPLLTPEQVKDAAQDGRRDHRLRRAVRARRRRRSRPTPALASCSASSRRRRSIINGRMPTQILPAQYFEVLIQLELQKAK